MTANRPRIVFLNRSFWPDIEATGQLLTDLCGGLASQYDVHVVCGQPNSPERQSRYVRVGTEHRDGVTIHRLAHRQFKKQNPFGRILNLLSFYYACRKYLRHTDMTADVVVSETDPFLLPIAGARYARRIGASHCVYLQDIYPDVAEAVGKVRVPFVAKYLRRRLRAVYRDASRVIVLGRCMRSRLCNPPWDIPADIIEIIPNWSDCQCVTPIEHGDNAFRQSLESRNDFVVMHSGNMGLTQRLDVLIHAANDPDWPDDAKLLLVGNGASRDVLLKLHKELPLPAGRVEFVDYQPRNKLAESLSAADVHVVSMHENIAGCLCPSKLYGIMAAGRPVIAIADPKTDLCQTVSELDLGWCVPPGSPTAIARAVAQACRELRSGDDADSRRESIRSGARTVALEQYDRGVVIGRFAEMLRRLSSDSRFEPRTDESEPGGPSRPASADASEIPVNL